MKNLILIIVTLFAFSIPMGACGIKPKSVDAPQGTSNDGVVNDVIEEDTFPRTYPAAK